MSSMSINRAPAAAQVKAAVTTMQIFPMLVNAAAPAALAIEASNVAEQKKMVVRASGYCTTAATLNVQVALYAVALGVPAANPLLVASYTQVAASTARAQNSVSAPWYIEAALIFDSVSGKMHGNVDATVNNLLDVHIALANVLTGLLGGVGAVEPVMVFVAAISFSVANAGNIGNLNELVLDA